MGHLTLTLEFWNCVPIGVMLTGVYITVLHPAHWWLGGHAPLAGGVYTILLHLLSRSRSIIWRQVAGLYHSYYILVSTLCYTSGSQVALLILHWYLITLLLLMCHTYWGHSVLSSVNVGCANTLLVQYITVLTNMFRHTYTLWLYP